MIRLGVHIPAEPQRVWEELADLGSHPEWMRDAVSISFSGEQTRGQGTEMTVLTRVGPLRTRDLMTVTEWNEGRSITVEHTGAVSGSGRFELSPAGGGTDLTWTESLRFPWWLGGGLGAWLARPLLRRVWRANLDRLSLRVSGEPRPPG